jgi:hypothetical protein
MVLLDDGRVYAHSGVFNPATSTDLQLTHYAADGSLVFNITHDVGGSEIGNQLRLMPNGNLVGSAIAVQQAPLFPYVDWLVVCYDPTGNLLWTDRYDGLQNNDEFIVDMGVNSRSETVVVGTGGPAVPKLCIVCMPQVGIYWPSVCLILLTVAQLISLWLAMMLGGQLVKVQP